MGAKRKSGGGGDTKTPKSLKVKAKDAEKLSLSETYGPQMKLFETWWSYAVSGDLNTEGPARLRPWHLPWDAACGLKGLLEPDVVHQLSQLICLHGMQTNPDASAGVERLAISSLRPQLGCAPGIRFSARDISGDAESLLEPHGVFYAKGFTRAFCCQTVLLCAYESPDFLKELSQSSEVMASFATIHAFLCASADGSSDAHFLIEQNRSITFQSALRRRPNAFNLLHQQLLLKKMGVDDSEFKAWQSAGELAEALKIGRAESQAAQNLLVNIDGQIVDRLKGLVKKWTMQRFITHDAIASGIFNRETCSATAAMTPWQAILLNNVSTLDLVCDRLNHDFNNLSLKFRKPFTHGGIELIQRNCAVFLECMREFARKYPAHYVEQEKDSLMKAFLLRHADSDLAALLADSVPPVDIHRIGIFRGACAKYDKQVAETKAKAADAISMQLAATNQMQMNAHATDDLDQANEYVKRAQQHANRQGGLDLQYLSQRYARGKTWCQNYMGKHQLYKNLTGLVEVHAEVLQLLSANGDPGDVYTLLVMDLSVFPNRLMDMEEACDAARSIMTANQNAALLVLFPVQHTSCDKAVTVKNRRLVEDRLMQFADLHDITIGFKDSGHGNDKRKRSHAGVLAISQVHSKSFGFSKSRALISGTIGPCDRARVSDLWSFDPDRPASPAQRAQQRGAECTKQVLSGLIDGIDVAGKGNKMYCVDLLPNRFNEWGRAVWILQLQFLKTPRQIDWRFLSFSHENGVFNSLEGIEKGLTAQVLTEYWDTCSDVGPSQRQVAAFDEAPPKLQALSFDAASLQLSLTTPAKDALGPKAVEWEKKLKVWNQEAARSRPAVPRPETASTSTTDPNQNRNRTSCRPTFADSERPTNCLRTLDLEPSSLMAITAFEAEKVLKASCHPIVNSDLCLAMTNTAELWLLNKTDAQCDAGPGELCGLNVGAFIEKPLGSASLVKDKAIGFVFTKDTDLLVVVEDGNKTPSCISELACDLAQKSGLTELSLADHNLTQLMEDGRPRPFRYDVKARAIINMFEPKALAADTDTSDIRGSMFGAAFLDLGLSKLPSSDMCSTLWEVRVNHTSIDGLKPKLWLTCNLALPAQTAVQLK